MIAVALVISGGVGAATVLPSGGGPATTARSAAAVPAPPSAPPTGPAAPSTEAPAAVRPAASTVDPTAVATKAQQAMLAVLPSADVSFEIFDRQSGTVLTSENPSRPFASMSVVKLLLALDVLAGDNWVLPDAATQQQLHQMLADSDDGIADNLWNADGGPAVVTRMVTLLGLTDTSPPEDPSEWGDTRISAADLVTVYRYITDQLPAPDRNLLVTALSDAQRTAADGFDQYFGIPDGLPHSTWAIKQGWGTSGADAVMNSTGLVGPDLRYVVVILSSAAADTYSELPAILTDGAAQLGDALSLTTP
jgi:hypothetical protein